MLIPPTFYTFARKLLLYETITYNHRTIFCRYDSSSTRPQLLHLPRHRTVEHGGPGTIDRLPQWIPTGYVVSSKGCSPADDNVHFSHDGYVALGKRYAYAALRHLGISYTDETSYVNTAASLFNIDYKPVIKKEQLILSIKSEKPIKKLDVVSYSGQTIHTFTPAKADITSYFYPLKGITDKVLIVVIEAQDGSKATKKCVF